MVTVPKHSTGKVIFQEITIAVLAATPANFIDAPLMPAAFEFGSHEDFEYFHVEIVAVHFSEAQDIGVIVHPGHGGKFRFVNESRSYFREFVGRHAHTDAGAADEDSPLGLTASYRPGDFPGEIRVIGGCLGIGANIGNFVPLAFQPIDDFQFQFIAAVVVANGDFHANLI
jgi:hypothetical protein